MGSKNPMRGMPAVPAGEYTKEVHDVQELAFLATTEDLKIIVDEAKKKPKEKKNVSENYYAVPEDDLQKIIIKAQAGSQVSQTELLKIFNNFLTKYVSLLFRSKYDLHDYDVRRFIALFITDRNVMIRLRRNQINHATFKAAGETMRGINYMIKRYADEEDVRQTVEMTFLQCIEKYTRKGSIPFSGYIYSYFFYLLKRNVDVFLIYQLGRKTFPLYTDDNVSSSSLSDDQTPIMTTIPETMELEDLYLSNNKEEYDENWVIGDTTMFPWDKLTVQQRQLLKWRYIDRIKASQIAEKTTEHPNTVRSQLQEIRIEIRNILTSELTI